MKLLGLKYLDAIQRRPLWLNKECPKLIFYRFEGEAQVQRVQESFLVVMIFWVTSGIWINSAPFMYSSY